MHHVCKPLAERTSQHCINVQVACPKLTPETQNLMRAPMASLHEDVSVEQSTFSVGHH